MNAHRCLGSCLVLLLALAGSVFGLPPDREVHYAIHQNPENPFSRVQYVLTLSITALEQDGDWIGWEVTNYKITEKAVLGSDTVWGVDLPFVDTDDGLWWVEHVDPNDPGRAEFAVAAPVSDRAVAQDPGIPDLYFDVVGQPNAVSPEGWPEDVTGTLNFAFWALPEPDDPPPAPDDPPDDNGDNEPVDQPVPSDPAPTSQ